MKRTQPETVFRKSFTVKKQSWMVEGWIGISGKAHCTIYKGRINPYGGFQVWDSVSEKDCLLVPAKVILASKEALDVAQKELKRSKGRDD